MTKPNHLLLSVGTYFFIWKKYCCLFNIASWLASNKTLWTRKCNRISSYNFFLPWTSGITSGIRVTWTQWAGFSGLILGEFFLRDTATLQLKAGLTLMTNLDYLCFSSNLITIPVQWCGFWVNVMGTALF